MSQNDDDKKTGCHTCMSLFDKKYCCFWRECVPQEHMDEGCEAIDPFPDFFEEGE